MFNNLSLLLPGPHRRATTPSKVLLHKPRRAQGHNSRQKPNFRLPRNECLVQATPRAAPAKPSDLLATHETHQDDSSEPSLQSTLPCFGIMGRVMRYILGFREKSIWRLCRTSYRILKGDTKGRKKELRVCYGGQSIGKQRDKGKKRSIFI